MTVNIEDQSATGSDEVTDAEYLAWEKGESHEPEAEAEAVEEERAEEPAAEEEPEAEVAEEGENEEAEPAPEAEPEPEEGLSRGLKKRLDKLREREAAALEREAAANARAAAAEALLAASRGEEPPEGETGAKPAAKDRVYTKAELDAETDRRAAELVAQQTFNQRCNDVADAGSKEFGAKFQDSLAVLNDVGVTQDAAFLNDVLDTEAPAKVLHHLGQNPDEAERIAGLSATRRAVALDRLAVQLAVEKPKAVKPLSNVPAPIKPVGSARGAKEIDINDPNLSDEEFYREAERLDRQRAAG